MKKHRLTVASLAAVLFAFLFAVLAASANPLPGLQMKIEWGTTDQYGYPTTRWSARSDPAQTVYQGAASPYLTNSFGVTRTLTADWTISNYGGDPYSIYSPHQLWLSDAIYGNPWVMSVWQGGNCPQGPTFDFRVYTSVQAEVVITNTTATSRTVMVSVNGAPETQLIELGQGQTVYYTSANPWISLNVVGCATFMWRFNWDIPTPTPAATATQVPHPMVNSIGPLGQLPGQEIEIFGTGFDRLHADPYNELVTFCAPNGGCNWVTRLTQGVIWSETYIRLALPANLAPDTDYGILVNVDGLNSAPPYPYHTGALPTPTATPTQTPPPPTATSTSLPPTPTSTPQPPAPAIKAILPPRAQPGAKVTIFGQNFGNPGDNRMVRICDSTGTPPACTIIVPSASDKRGAWSQKAISILLPGTLLPNHRYIVSVEVNGASSLPYEYQTGRRGPLPPVKIPTKLPLLKTN